LRLRDRRQVLHLHRHDVVAGHDREVDRDVHRDVVAGWRVQRGQVEGRVCAGLDALTDHLGRLTAAS